MRRWFQPRQDRRRLDWGREFWRFTLMYVLWPPFAWRVSLGMKPLIGIMRFTKPLVDYFSLAAGTYIALLALSVSQPWWLRPLLWLTTASLVVQVLLRLQVAYLYRHKEKD